MPRPVPTRIFHITPIANLVKICAARRIHSKNALAAAGDGHVSVAHATIQTRRATKRVNCAPGGVVHDYVPFYFAPRSPMLHAIQNGKVQGNPWQQDDIVHIESTVENIVSAGGRFVVYPISAALDYSVDCYGTVDDLDRIDWPLFFELPLVGDYAKYYHSRPGHSRHERRSDTRLAEFLVHGSSALSSLTRIGVINNAKQAEVVSVLSQHGVELPVEVQPDWYFLGQ